MGMPGEVEIQQHFFARIAERYHEECVPHGEEHFFALAFLLAAIDYLGFESILRCRFRDREGSLISQGKETGVTNNRNRTGEGNERSWLQRGHGPR